VACQGNATLAVFDLMAKRVTQTFDVGDSPDVLAEDGANHRFYVAAESGQLATFDTTGGSVSKLRGKPPMSWDSPQACWL
jgi:DNA-binding beta-propeller fold protein YncE